MIAWTLVVATFVGVAWLAVLLARQGHPGRLSGGEVLARWRRSRVMDRPAGPDAEAMSVGGPGQPRVAPYAGDGAGDEIGVDGRLELASPTAERSADAERLVDRDSGATGEPDEEMSAMTPSGTKLQRLHAEFDQSPWLDDLKRGWITGGALEAWVARGVRGVTSNPTTFHRAIAGDSQGSRDPGDDDYDAQFRDLVSDGASVEASYWAMVQTDITAALDILRPVYDASGGTDGFVSVELAPDLAHDREGSISGARLLHQAIAEPNLLVKIPGTSAGVGAFEAVIAEGRSVNVTLLFGLQRYAEVMEAYLRGLESLAQAGGDMSQVRSVASFFVSRVDAEVDWRLERVGGGAPDLVGRAAVANARLAYALFQEVFRGERWERLRARGAQPQRPLWASMAPKSAAYPDTLYVDSLIGRQTVGTMPAPILRATEDHGTLARTLDADLDGAGRVFDRLREHGIDMEDVALTLESQGVAAFSKSYNDLLGALQHKADQQRRR